MVEAPPHIRDKNKVIAIATGVLEGMIPDKSDHLRKDIRAGALYWSSDSVSDTNLILVGRLRVASHGHGLRASPELSLSWTRRSLPAPPSRHLLMNRCARAQALMQMSRFASSPGMSMVLVRTPPLPSSPLAKSTANGMLSVCRSFASSLQRLVPMIIFRTLALTR